MGRNDIENNIRRPFSLYGYRQVEHMSCRFLSHYLYYMDDKENYISRSHLTLYEAQYLFLN
jgi:hypothetical protein